MDDGSRPIEEYVTWAIEHNFDALGFSCHTPVPYEDDWHLAQHDLQKYFDEIKRLKKEYVHDVELYTGLELDYADDRKELLGSEFQDRVDYVIASVHMFRDADGEGYLSFDGPETELQMLLDRNFENDGRRMAEAYYHCLCEMMDRHTFDILGHIDLIKKRNRHNRFFDQTQGWYRDAALQALEAAARNHVRLEVNTGGIARGAIDEPYPAVWMLKHCKELGIRLVLSADAHRPQDLMCAFDTTLSHIRDAGYRELDVLYGGKWITTDI